MDAWYRPVREMYSKLQVIHAKEEIIDALIEGCPGRCKRVSTELDVIRMILDQSAGANRRTLKHSQEICSLRAHLKSVNEFSGLVGRSPQMQMACRLILDVAPADATVLIQGESGTGKEVVARAIHDRSLRKDGPFVVINCSGYPSTLLEREVFGHEKGAFPGAVRRKKAALSRPTAARSFWMKSERSPPLLRSSCCGCCRAGSSSALIDITGSRRSPG